MTSYPDPPGPRIAYDIDGTVGFVKPYVKTSYPQDLKSSVLPVEIPSTVMKALNSDRTSGAVFSSAWNISYGPFTYDPAYFYLIFPSPIHLQGVFIANTSAGVLGNTAFRGRYSTLVSTSSDTTSGVDGTWVDVMRTTGPPDYIVGSPSSQINRWPPGYTQSLDVLTGAESYVAVQSEEYNSRIETYYRQDSSTSPDGYGWTPLAGAGTRDVRALRILIDGLTPEGSPQGAGLYHLHVYGEPEVSNTNRLSFTSPTGEAMDFNLDDVVQGDVIMRSFKVRNNSLTKTATGIELVAIEASPASTPSLAGAMQFSANGTVWSSTLTVASLAPGESSSTLYLRVTVPTTGVLGPWSPRVSAEVGVWS